MLARSLHKKLRLFCCFSTRYTKNTACVKKIKKPSSVCILTISSEHISTYWTYLLEKCTYISIVTHRFLHSFSSFSQFSRFFLSNLHCVLLFSSLFVKVFISAVDFGVSQWSIWSVQARSFYLLSLILFFICLLTCHFKRDCKQSINAVFICTSN